MIVGDGIAFNDNAGKEMEKECGGSTMGCGEYEGKKEGKNARNAIPR